MFNGDGSDIGAYEVQTLTAPLRYVSSSGGVVTVYWPNVSAWSLRQNNNLGASAGCSVNSGWTTSSGTNYLNITPPTGSLIFRLKQSEASAATNLTSSGENDH